MIFLFREILLMLCLRNFVMNLVQQFKRKMLVLSCTNAFGLFLCLQQPRKTQDAIDDQRATDKDKTPEDSFHDEGSTV